MGKPLLSGLDWQILEHLQANARTTISALANRLNRSRSSIAEHVKHLQDSGVLTAATVRVSEEKLGFGLTAFVRLQANSSSHREIVELIDDIPEVVECHVLTGNDLLMMRVIARDMPHLRDLVDGFTVWGATTTDVIFSTVKHQSTIGPALRRAATPSSL